MGSAEREGLTIDTQLALRRSLSEGLSAWLTFESHCGRADLFSERYLSLPIAQILATNTFGRVVAEHKHPVLVDAGAVGRPPQLDFIVQEQDQVKLVVESKWAGTSAASVKDVVWDCVRLELAADHYGCDAMFVLAGTRAKVGRLLSSKPFNPATSRGKSSLVLGLHGQGRYSVNVQSPRKAFGPSLHRLLQNYPQVAFPRSFVCGHGTQVPRDASADAFTAVVWHIRPEERSKRFTFRAVRR